MLQSTSAGSTFLRWRTRDFARMGGCGLGTPGLQQSPAAGRTRGIAPFRMQSHRTEPADECGAFALPPGHHLRDQNGQRRTAAAPVHNRSGGITMSTFFVGEGNIGSAPEFQEFASGNDEPRRLLRLNV